MVGNGEAETQGKMQQHGYGEAWPGVFEGATTSSHHHGCASITVLVSICKSVAMGGICAPKMLNADQRMLASALSCCILDRPAGLFRQRGVCPAANDDRK